MTGRQALADLCRVLLAAAALSATAMAATVAEPDGFRLDDYRAPVPETVAGAEVLNAAKLHEVLARNGAILIDVLPAPRRPAATRPGTPWMPVVHKDIPGSLWWPDVGRGELAADAERHFRRRLAAVTAGEPGRLVVFYCQRDCWLSWNATKRASGYGIRAAWFPDGTQGWQEAGFPLQDVQPEFLE